MKQVYMRSCFLMLQTVLGHKVLTQVLSGEEMSLGMRLMIRKVPRSFSITLTSLKGHQPNQTHQVMHNLRQQFLQKTVMRKGMKLQLRNRYVTKLSMYNKICSLFLKRRQSGRIVISWRMQYSWHKSG